LCGPLIGIEPRAFHGRLTLPAEWVTVEWA
jgi:hypothetical protein